jgi:hypothetical protein
MKAIKLMGVALAALLAGGAARVFQDQCGPFTDVTPGFCPYVLELYDLGVTVGTSATTFSPDDPLTRGQGAVFIAKGLNQSLIRSSRRAALQQFWSNDSADFLAQTPTGVGPMAVRSDGADLWVAALDGTVTRVSGSDGKVLDTWTGATNATRVLVAMGRVFVLGTPSGSAGRLYVIDPTQSPGAITSVADLGSNSSDLAFDGNRLWVCNRETDSQDGSLSLIDPGTWNVTAVTGGFTSPTALVFDGSSMWMAQAHEFSRLDAQGAVVQSVPIEGPSFPVFDGQNIWVPARVAGLVGEVFVVRPATGEIVRELPFPDSQDSSPYEAVFDGRRILVSDSTALRVALWNAADLTSLGQVTTAAPALGACSDGHSIWLALRDANKLIRF